MDGDAWLELQARAAQDAYLHTAQGLRVRHGVHLTPSEYLRLCDAILLALPRLRVRETGGDRCRLIYPVQGRWPELIFERGAGLIITALTTRGAVLPMKGRVRRQMERANRRRRSHSRRRGDSL